MSLTKTERECKEKHCNGKIDPKKSIPLPVSRCPRIDDSVYPCTDCGRLHREDGETVQDRMGNKAFWENEKIVYKDENNNFIY